MSAQSSRATLLEATMLGTVGGLGATLLAAWGTREQAGGALLLAAMGLFGVVAGSVTRR